MKNTKIIAAADFHFSRDSQKQALASLEIIYETAQTEQVDLVAIAGDLFDRSVQNTAVSGFPKLINMIQRILDVCPIVAVTGTPTHDIAGCYEALRTIKAKHSFILIDPVTWSPPVAWLCEDGHTEVEIWSKENPVSDGHTARLMILGLPEPSKEWFLKDKQFGGDEANEAIKEGMRKLFLGLGAQRKEYPDIPCLFLYHGLVEGSTIQKHQVIRPGGISIGRDDLASIGFDYGALGHIHLAQQIGDLPAYYSGSAIYASRDPWSETDQKGFNIIEFVKTLDGTFHDEPETNKRLFHVSETGLNTFVERRPFPHPPRKKIIVDNENPPAHPHEGVEGYQVWFVLKTRTRLSDGNQKMMLDALLEDGALPGSRVTIEIIPTETLRAGEIVEAKHLRDKLKIYAESSEQKLAESIYEKADVLELEARKEGSIPRGAHIRNDKLCLRGAWGIKKGLGLDEVTIDFSQYDEDLIALVGPNGAGKTTLIENMHPYAEIFTRGGKLQDHFYLKDSWRDLYFTDEKTGDKYRAFIQIDGANQTGKSEYHLYKNGEPITNGRKEDYEQKINGIYGSIALYLRSAFSSQKSTKTNPDLGEATKGEKKALFRELGGLDYLQLHAESSKEKGKAIGEHIIRDQGRIETFEQLVAVLPEKENNHAIHVGILADEKKVLAGIEAEGRSYRQKKEDLQKRVDKHREVDTKLINASRREEELREEHYDTCASIDGYKQALEGRENAAKNEARYTELKTEYDKLDLEYRDAKEIATNSEREIQAKKAKATEKVAECRQKKAVLIQKVDNLNGLLSEKITCPKCGHIFSRGQKEIEVQLEEAQQKIIDIDFDMTVPEAELEKLNAEFDNVVWPKETGLIELNEDLRAIDIELYKTTIADANIAEAKIEETQKRFVVINEQQADLKAQIRELKDKLDPEAETLYDHATADLQSVIDKYNECKQSIAGIEASIKHIEQEIADIEEKKAQRDELKKAIKDSQIEMIEWQYLQHACGPDGIQALELDAMGPSVAEIGTGLLGIAYDIYPWDASTRKGNPFNQMKFETTRIGGQGSKRKQIEDFQIFVFDNRDNTWSNILMISGGESVWSKRALYDAFGIVADTKTDQRFLTAYQDEADGALDPEARLAYFKMLEAAHQESGRRHTIVITHSPEAQEFIAQKIEMEEFK